MGCIYNPSCNGDPKVTVADIEADKLAKAEKVERAEQGDPAAQFDLGLKSGATEYWFCRAASNVPPYQGNAMYRLGHLFEQRGDYIEAYKWYALAGTHPNANWLENWGVVDRDRIARILTEPALDEAGRRVAAWKPGDCGERPKEQAKAPG